MKTFFTLVCFLCLEAIITSCGPNTDNQQKVESTTNSEKPSSETTNKILKQSIHLTNGEWQPDCSYPNGYFKITNKEIELDLSYGEVGVLSLILRMKIIQGTGEIHLFFDKISLLRLPMGDEEYYAEPPSEEDISKDRLVGKLIPVSANRLEFTWDGLYHLPTKTTLYKDKLDYQVDQKGKMTLNFCD